MNKMYYFLIGLLINLIFGIVIMIDSEYDKAIMLLVIIVLIVTSPLSAFLTWFAFTALERHEKREELIDEMLSKHESEKEEDNNEEVKDIKCN